MDQGGALKGMGAPAYALVVAVLATWRVTHLLQAEDGPGDVFVRLRRAVGEGFWGRLLDCFYCLSLWVAAPFAVITGYTWVERGMLWLALSGGACLLERLKPSPPAPLYVEDEEDRDGVLRQQASDGIDTSDPGAGPASGGAAERDAGAHAAPFDSRTARPGFSDPGSGGAA